MLKIENYAINMSKRLIFFGIKPTFFFTKIGKDKKTIFYVLKCQVS